MIFSNSLGYIKFQTGSVKKYIKEDSMEKYIFLVVPSHTVDIIKSIDCDGADDNGYILTRGALDPPIFSLGKIEDCEFVDQ